MKGNKENWTHCSDFIKEMQYFKFNTTALSVAQSDFWNYYRLISEESNSSIMEMRDSYCVVKKKGKQLNCLCFV